MILPNIRFPEPAVALEKLVQNAIIIQCKRDLELYKRSASDPDFKRAFDTTIARELVTQATDLMPWGYLCQQTTE